MKIGQIHVPMVEAYVTKKQNDMAKLARRKTALIEKAGKFEENIKAEGRDRRQMKNGNTIVSSQKFARSNGNRSES